MKENHNYFIEDIYKTYRGYIYTVVFNELYDKNDVEEVVQDVFLLAIKKCEILKCHNSIKGWLSTTARITSYNYNKRYLKKLKMLEHDPKYLENYKVDNFDNYIIEKLRFAEYMKYNTLQNLFIELSEEEKALYKMRFIQKKSISELAGVYNIQKKVVSQRIWRLRRKIREFINSTGS